MMVVHGYENNKFLHIFGEPRNGGKLRLKQFYDDLLEDIKKHPSSGETAYLITDKVPLRAIRAKEITVLHNDHGILCIYSTNGTIFENMQR